MLIQIAETVLPIFGVPDWVLRFLVLALAVGFIPVILLSWIYEITPEGIKKEAEASTNDSISNATGRKIGIATIGLLVAITIISLIRPQSVSHLETAHTELIQGVAVLPFENISANEENEFFASGVQEDILTHLTSIQNLRVISRTSVKSYVGSNLQIPEIAQQLGVTHVVEGSVRRAGNRVRITVQLIDGTTDKHIWAQNYDRTLEDIFAIQSEIAQKIVSAIKSKLSPEEQISLVQTSTNSPKAFEFFHRAQATVKVGVRSPNAMLEPIRLMQLAVEEDPNYLQAWLKLVEYCGYAFWWEATEYEKCVDTAIEQVARLAPDTAELELADGIHAYRILTDYQKAYSHLLKAIQGLPNSEVAWTYLSYVSRRLNKWDTAEESLLKVTQLNPLAEQERIQYIVTVQFSGDWQRAIAIAEEVSNKFPDWQLVRIYLATLRLQYLGNVDDYKSLVNDMPVHLRWNYGRPFIEDIFENDEARIEWIKSIKELAPGAEARVNAELGLLATARGDKTRGQEYFNKTSELWRAVERNRVEEQSTFLLPFTAHIKARAGDVDGAKAALDLFYVRLEAQPDELLQNEIAHIVIYARMALNETDLAWQEINRVLSSGYGITAWDLKYDLLYKYFFEHLDEYQALVSELEVGRPPKSLSGENN